MKPPLQRLLGLGCLPLALLAGCAANRAQLAHTSSTGSRETPYTLSYHVHIPDALELTIANRPDLSGAQRVGADGRIELGELGRLRVNGYTTAEIAELVAEAIPTSRDNVAVRVVEFKSQQIYLFGQVEGAQRPVPYQGGEPVLQLLQRVGGITPGAEPNDIYVVRPRLASGRPPEVFHVHLREILSGKDSKSNLMVQPFDEVHVGERRKSCFFKCLPPCLRPFFKSFCGMRRPGALGP